MQPTDADLHVDALLTNVSIKYTQDQTQFVSRDVFTNIPVNFRSDRYAIYDRDAWWRDEAEERAPSTESAGIDYSIDTTPNYYCRVYAIHKDVDEQMLANAENQFTPLADAAEIVQGKLLLKQENLWVSKFFKTGVWATDLTGVTTGPTGPQFLMWDQAGNTVIENITTQGIMMMERTGKKPNTLVVSPYVFNSMMNDPEILDRIKYTQRGIVTADLLAALFQVERFLVPGCTQALNKEGVTPSSYAFIYGKAALLCYSERNPGLQKASAGYTFSWNGYLGAGNNGQRVIRFPMLHLRSQRVEAEMAFDQKLVAADLGVFFSNAVA